jgi:hypothetical protein
MAADASNLGRLELAAPGHDGVIAIAMLAALMQGRLADTGHQPQRCCGSRTWLTSTDGVPMASTSLDSIPHELPRGMQGQPYVLG